MQLSPEEDRQRGLTRERLVEAALALINDDGLEGLSMRALADRLEVKAASLYWHVRDRRELLELLAEGILEGVPRTRRSGDWRRAVLAASEALRRRVAAQKDAERILLEVPEALERSEVLGDLKAHLQGAGLQPNEASDVARMAITYVMAGGSPGDTHAVDAGAEPASLAIDSGSRGVVLRAGPPGMQTLIRVPHDQNAAAPAVVLHGTVVVRRLRGVGRGELELNPGRPWRFKVQAPTWNTVLDLAGLDVRGIHVDSGAAKLECYLPVPRGVVPIHISSGVAKVALHRPGGAAVVANVSTGAVKLKLDDLAMGVTISDVHWESEDAAGSADRYELQVSSGAVNVTLDTYAPRRVAVAAAGEPRTAGKASSALDILLDGVEARVRPR
jgi:TetR/AcrR family tetracycline transcriptional repressor